MNYKIIFPIVGLVAIIGIVFALNPIQESDNNLSENLEKQAIEIVTVFDLNYCPNQNKIVGEMWFLNEESIPIPIRATIHYEINDLDNLIEEGEIKITPKSFENWSLFGKEMHAYNFEIPVQNNVTDKNLIFTVMLDGDSDLVYEDIIKRLPSLDNCKYP